MPLVSPSTPMPPTPLPTNFPPIMGIAVVQSVDVQILESLLLQVHVSIRGQLPDEGCATISSRDQKNEKIYTEPEFTKPIESVGNN